MTVRDSALVLFMVGAFLLAGCAGTPTAAQPTTATDETFPEPLPTADGGDPFDTVPPDLASTDGPSPSPNDAGLICYFVPPAVGAGGSVFLQIAEVGGWYGSDRYYWVTGVPDLQYQEFYKPDGGLGLRYILAFDVPDYLAGSSLDISVEMRDWDPHAPPALPGTAFGSPRPDATRHESVCTGHLNVLLSVPVST